LEAEVVSNRRVEEGATPMLKKLIYSLASLAALALAVGAGWKPN
jgi:hypothetical protein